MQVRGDRYPLLLTAPELMGKGQSINAGTIVGRRR